MEYYATLILCFVPLLAMFIVLKLALLLNETKEEVKHVHEESLKQHTYLEGVYDDIDEEDKWSDHRREGEG